MAKGTIKGKNRASSLTIELTISNDERDSSDQSVRRITAEQHFHDEAFIPKTFTIRLNPTYFRTLKKKGISRSLAYSYALFFDRSPYPPPDEWKDRETGLKCCEVRDFFGIKVNSRHASFWIGIKHHLRYVIYLETFKSVYTEDTKSHRCISSLALHLCPCYQVSC